MVIFMEITLKHKFNGINMQKKIIKGGDLEKIKENFKETLQEDEQK